MNMFRIGETAMIRANISPVGDGMAKYLGETIVIESQLHFVCACCGPMYLVRCLADLTCFWTPPWTLKKLPPSPSSTDMLDTAEPRKPTRWTDCPWKPEGVRA